MHTETIPDSKLISTSSVSARTESLAPETERGGPEGSNLAPRADLPPQCAESESRGEIENTPSSPAKPIRDTHENSTPGVFTGYSKPCDFCKEKFHPRTVWHRYCKQQCRDSANNKNRREALLAWRAERSNAVTTTGESDEIQQQTE